MAVCYAQAAESSRLQQLADDMARRMREAENRMAGQAAELERLQREAQDRAGPSAGPLETETEDRAEEQSDEVSMGSAQDRFLEVLQSDAEQRALGDHDSQELARWEAEIEADNPQTQVEQDIEVTQRPVAAFAPLQDEHEDIPDPEQVADVQALTEATVTASRSRPVTQFGFQSIFTSASGHNEQYHSGMAHQKRKAEDRAAQEQARLRDVRQEEENVTRERAQALAHLQNEAEGRPLPEQPP